MRIYIDVEWLPPSKPDPPVLRWQRDLIQLGIALAGACLRLCVERSRATMAGCRGLLPLGQFCANLSGGRSAD
jgi:hypothetical protein